jgi:hypothetical protein
MLSLLLVFQPSSSTTVASEAGVFVVTALLVLVNVLLYVRFRPYAVRRAYKFVVKLLALLVTFASCVSNFVGGLYVKGAGSLSPVVGMAWIVFGLLLLLIATVITQFVRSTWKDVRDHGVAVDRRLRTVAARLGRLKSITNPMRRQGIPLPVVASEKAGHPFAIQPQRLVMQPAPAPASVEVP